MLNEFRSTNITWDKATSRIYSPVTANESDENGRKLVVQIINGGQVEALTGTTLHLYWITRDKLHDGLDVFKAVDLNTGEFELSYTTGMLSNKGVLNANLVLVDAVGRVVSERFKITVTEGIDNDAIQSENSFSSLTQALIDISNLEQNYAPRLNDLTAQLQQTENIQSIKRLSETEPVRVATFDGTNEPVHPSVVYIPNGWGVTSTKYWMAYTPWPVKTIRERNDRYECPSLLTSYNGIDWFVHPNTPNPLVDLTQIQIDNGDYYSDPSIVMNGNTMEIWYRWTNGANFNETNIYRITSTNGVAWTSPELVLDALKSDSGIFGTMRAQQIFYDGVTYKSIYGVLGGAGGMEYAESTNPSSGVWKNVKKVIFNNAPDQFDPWHTGISISNNIYHMVAYDKRKALDYFVSSDGINFNFVSTISEEKDEIISSFVDFYQSYPIKIKDLWYLFVTGTLKRGRSSSRRDLVIFSGNSLTDLTPVRAGGINRTLYFNEHPVLNNSIGPEAVQNLVYATFKDTYKNIPTGYGMSFGTTDLNNAPAWYSYTKKSPIVFVYENPSDAGGIPPHIGMMWRNTLTKKVWIATGTSSSADWKQLDFISDPVINTQRSDINVADSISVTGIYRGILKSGTGNQISYLTGLTDGQEIILINTAGSNVTLKNSNAGTGSMRLKSGVDRVLTNNDTASFIAVGTAWYEK